MKNLMMKRRNNAATDVEDPPRKTFTLQIKDAEKGEVEAVFSTFNVKDHDDDLTLPGAFENGADVVIGSWGHATLFGDKPVGKGQLVVTEKDVRLVGKYFLDTIEGRDQFTTLKHVGGMQEWSYGYDVLATGEITEKMRQQGVRRVLSKLAVLEVSPVLRGAGIRTRTVTAKNQDPPAGDPPPEADPKPTDPPPAPEPPPADPAPTGPSAEEKAASEAAAAQRKAAGAEAVEDFLRFQRTHKRMGLI